MQFHSGARGTLLKSVYGRQIIDSDVYMGWMEREQEAPQRKYAGGHIWKLIWDKYLSLIRHTLPWRAEWGGERELQLCLVCRIEADIVPWIMSTEMLRTGPCLSFYSPRSVKSFDHLFNSSDHHLICSIVLLLSFHRTLSSLYSLLKMLWQCKCLLPCQ